MSKDFENNESKDLINENTDHLEEQNTDEKQNTNIHEIEHDETESADEKKEIEEENLKDKFNPADYIPNELESPTKNSMGKLPYIIFGVIILLGILAYVIIGNLSNPNRIDDLSKEEEVTETVENNTVSIEVNDYKQKFWSGDTSLTLNQAFNNYSNAKNIEWLLYEKDGRFILQIKAELDTKKILDFNSPDIKISETGGNISEMAYLYIKKYQNEIKIYDSSYFYISRENPAIENLDLAKREIEITNGKEVYTAEYSKDLSDIYNSTFNYSRTLEFLNNFYLKSVPKKSINISVKFDSEENADAELNKVYQSLVSVLNDDQRIKLSTAQRAWLEYRDAEFEFLSSIFSIKDDPNSLAIMDKYTKSYKIKIIETRINELNAYKDIISKNGSIKIDENDINKQKDSVKDRYATLLSHLSGNSQQQMKNSQSKWTTYIDNDTIFAESIVSSDEASTSTLGFNPYPDRHKMLQSYDEVIF